VDGRLEHLTYDGTWPARWEFLGGSVLTSDPSAVSPSVGRIEVFAKNSSNAMMQRSYSNFGSGWGPWRSMPFGVFSSAPDAAFQAGGRMDVFALGQNRSMWQSTYTNGIWSGWRYLGGVFSADPAAVSSGAGRLDVVGRGQDYGIWQFWNNG
jgi:hypothetical protein